MIWTFSPTLVWNDDAAYFLTQHYHGDLTERTRRRRLKKITMDIEKEQCRRRIRKNGLHHQNGNWRRLYRKGKEMD